MRFNTVEVERAYMDYLDSLDDWPPPQGAAGEASAAMWQATDDERSTPTNRFTSQLLHS